MESVSLTDAHNNFDGFMVLHCELSQRNTGRSLSCAALTVCQDAI